MSVPITLEEVRAARKELEDDIQFLRGMIMDTVVTRRDSEALLNKLTDLGIAAQDYANKRFLDGVRLAEEHMNKNARGDSPLIAAIVSVAERGGG